MPTTRSGALHGQQRGDEGDVTPTEEEYSTGESGDPAEPARSGDQDRAHGRDSASGDSQHAQQAASQIPSEQFLSALIESITRAQAEANRSLISSLLTSTSNFRASTPAAVSPAHGGGGGAASSSVIGAASASANFTKCTARFNGSSPDAENLEAFLDAVEIYKECAAVSDEYALRGLPMLLEGEAAVWWRGVRASVTTWRDALARLRSTYGMAQPAHKVLRQIFSAEQRDDERAETYLCKLRALISRLPYKLEELQIDMCFYTDV